MVFIVQATLVPAQEILKKAAPFGKDLIDTLFIDNNVDNWSIRAFSSFKDQTFGITNDDLTVRFVPNNRYGAGLGYANSKIKLDFGFSFGGGQQGQTDRFSFETDLSLGKSFFGIKLARFRGFEVESDDLDIPVLFRNDIRTFNLSLFYTVIPNYQRVSISSAISGSEKQKRNAGSFMGGAFAFYNRIRADSSIIPVNAEDMFNDRAEIEQLDGFAVGLIGGYAYNFVFLKNFFFNVAAYPGVALNLKFVETETISYTPSNLWSLTVGTRAALGYNINRIYIELSNKYTLHYSSFNFGNRGVWNATRLKFVVGWKLRAK